MDPKKNGKQNKEVLNIIRTTMRNNMDLTQIADNKANVLLSLNALMITFLAPFVLSNMDMILRYRLGVPLLLLVASSLLTIYLSTLVLVPRGFNANKMEALEKNHLSPFFFGNFHKMSKEEFMEYFDSSTIDWDRVKIHIVEDLFNVGVVLGRKMSIIKLAFRVFMIGFFVSIALAVILIFIYSGTP